MTNKLELTLIGIFCIIVFTLLSHIGNPPKKPIIKLNPTITIFK